MLRIGPYTLPGPVLLAPMAGVTDAPFREICQQYGAGLTTSEMLIANSKLWDSQKSRQRLRSTNSQSVPNSIQIVGSEPAQMADAAYQATLQGAQIVDINMGCPAKKVCKKAAGSALLKDEQLVNSILQAVVQAVDVPVTLKIRTGWSPDQRNARQIARIAEDNGIQSLVIHGRTRACRFNGYAEYDTIADVKQSVTIPVIANGDIDSVEKALQVAKHTQADGLMIGRPAQGQPWLIQQISQALQGEQITAVSDQQKQDTLLLHLTALHQFYGEYLGLRIARKHISWYLEKMDFERHYQKTFNRLETESQQTDFLQQLLTERLKSKAA